MIESPKPVPVEVQNVENQVTPAELLRGIAAAYAGGYIGVREACTYAKDVPFASNEPPDRIKARQTEIDHFLSDAQPGQPTLVAHNGWHTSGMCETTSLAVTYGEELSLDLDLRTPHPMTGTQKARIYLKDAGETARIYVGQPEIRQAVQAELPGVLIDAKDTSKARQVKNFFYALGVLNLSLEECGVDEESVAEARNRLIPAWQTSLGMMVGRIIEGNYGDPKPLEPYALLQAMRAVDRETGERSVSNVKQQLEAAGHDASRERRLIMRYFIADIRPLTAPLEP